MIFFFFFNSLGFSLWSIPWNNQKSKSARGSWKSMCKMGSKGKSGSLGLNFEGELAFPAFFLHLQTLNRGLVFPWLGCKTQARPPRRTQKKLQPQYANTSCTELPAAFLGPKFPARWEIWKVKAAKPILCPSRQAAHIITSKRWEIAWVPVSET